MSSAWGFEEESTTDSFISYKVEGNGYLPFYLGIVAWILWWHHREASVPIVRFLGEKLFQGLGSLGLLGCI